MNPVIHTCNAMNCSEAIESKFLMCRAHWAMVPRSLQQRIWLHYQPGQENHLSIITPAYLAVMKEAIEIVAKKEQTPKARAAERTYDYDYPD